MAKNWDQRLNSIPKNNYPSSKETQTHFKRRKFCLKPRNVRHVKLLAKRKVGVVLKFSFSSSQKLKCENPGLIVHHNLQL